MSLFDDASLVLIPDGAKDGTLYSVKPTDGTGDFTFTRGSNLAATRVDENGLIEKGRENLLLQSNKFNTTWVTYLTSLTSSQSGYDGTSDAWLIEKSGAFGSVFQNLSSSGVRAYSVYAKAGSYDFLALRFRNTSNNYRTAYFDLSNGTLGSVDPNIIKHTIEDIGSGWYRCQIAFNDSAVNQVLIYPSNVNNGIGNSGTGNIYIQDAQLEQGLVATDYIETGASTAQAGILEDLPRIDYSGGASCPALLLEPQRTNLITNSEYFGTWTGSTYITSNYAISPDGSQNASRCLFTGSNQVLTITSSLSTGVSCSATIYVKGTSGETIRLAAGGVDTMHTLNGDWQRIETNATSINSTFVLNTFGGATARDLLIFGAQLEEASYPTSYIPTYGSSVTRGVDNPIISSAGSIIDINQGTLFIDVTIDSNVNTENYLIKFDGVNFNDTLYLYRSTIGKIQGVYRIGGSAYKEETTSAISGRLKAAFAYDSNNDCTLYVNGSKIGSSFSIPTPSVNLTAIRLGGFNDTLAKQSGGTHQSLYFPTALTDSELSALTRPYNTYQEWVDGEGLTWESKSCTNQSILELQNL